MINRNKQQSFTLIELLVVIVIIGILAGVIMISTSSSIDKANIAKSKVFEESVQNNLAANMVSRWTLDEVRGTAAPYTTPDQWGSNTGTLYGTNGLPQLRPASECVTDGCFKFDGVDDYVECQNTDNLNIKDSITISVWLNVASDIQYIIQKETLSTIWYGYRLDIYPPNLRWYIWKDPNPPSLSTSFVNYFNKWTFVTVTYDKNVGRKIYINGNFIISDEITGSIGITSNKFRIAGDAGDQGVIGLVDDVKLYNMVLSSSQIRKEYIAGIESLYSKGIISRDKFEKRLAEL